MDIVPFTSVGILKFGDSRQEAREKLDSNFTTFRKHSSEIETDAFENLHIHLYYDQERRLEFVEAFAPAEVTLHGITFLGRNLGDVILDMKSLGFIPTESDDTSAEFEGAGIALTAPSGVVETVAAHRKGYYEQ